MIPMRATRLGNALLAALLALASCEPAYAAPPPAGSPDANALAPYSAWIEQQETPHGGRCCSDADGREVDARISADGHYEVRFVHPEDIPEGGPEPGRWYPVPDANVLHAANPSGAPIAWWYPSLSTMQHDSPIRCFAPADGT